ncbi:MAG: PKD domain-containing protein, partial [Thermoplasmata archaeon]
MVEERTERTELGRWRGSRGLSTVTAAVIMIVVIVIVGAAGYFAFTGQNKTSTVTGCTPPSSPQCSPFSNTHDMSLLVPYASAQAYTAVPFSAGISAGLSPSSYTFNFGDGTSQTTTSSSTTHTYTSPGTYLATVTSLVNGVTHDNYRSITKVTVLASALEPNSQNLAGVAASITGNSTTTSGASAIISANQEVTFSGSYSSAPTNPAYTLATPQVVVPA